MDHGLNYWLGRQDSQPGNGGIEKSTYFACLFNAHSEKSMRFDQLPINRLPAIQNAPVALQRYRPVRA